jgi:fructose-bisphosphate aldolase class 1
MRYAKTEHEYVFKFDNRKNQNSYDDVQILNLGWEKLTVPQVLRGILRLSM